VSLRVVASPAYRRVRRVSSRQPTSFLVSTRKEAKKRPLPTRPSRCEGCLALLGLCGSGRTHYVRCAHCVQTAARSQLLMRAEARPAKPCAAQLVRRGRRTPDSARCASHDDASLRSRRCEASLDRESLRSKRPYCSSGPVGGVEERRGLGPRAQHASSTDFARLFERSERSERSEFGARPHTPSTAEQSGPSRTATVGSPFFCLLFFGEAKKSRSAVGTTSRIGLTQ
jgi:hypothetical protein